MPDEVGSGAVKRYVVAHNRDRDFYQVALALEEVGALAKLITDHAAYRANPIHRLVLSRLLKGREEPPLDRDHVRGNWRAIVFQALARWDRRTGTDWMQQVDRTLADAARRTAIALPGSDLLLYHNNALEAFREPRLVNRRRHLFLYHPHPRYTQSVLQMDFDQFGVGVESLREEATQGLRVERLDAELALADHVICASSISARSIQFASVTDAPVSVVPYGIAGGRAAAPVARQPRPTSPVRFLFVGQAVQRKGLHHLLKVWRTLRPAGAKLTLVCSRNQDAILDDLPPGVVLRSNLSNAELLRLYATSHCFVLPALIEGFGLVLLEALNAGCFTIFSNATGLADCDVPAFAGREVDAGDLDGLATAIEGVIAATGRGELDADAIAAFGRSRSAAQFRVALRASLGVDRPARSDGAQRELSAVPVESN